MPFAMTLAVLRDGHDVRGSAGRARRSTPRGRSIAPHDVGSLEPGKLADAVIVRGEAIDLVRVGASVIAGVLKRGVLVADANCHGMTLTASREVPISSRISARRRRRPAADRPRPWPARSARRCWRWSPRCRSRAAADERAHGARRRAALAGLGSHRERWSTATATPTTTWCGAYRLPKETDEEKAARRPPIQDALKAPSTRRST